MFILEGQFSLFAISCRFRKKADSLVSILVYDGQNFNVQVRCKRVRYMDGPGFLFFEESPSRKNEGEGEFAV